MQRKMLEEKELEECKRSSSRSPLDMSNNRSGLYSARGNYPAIHDRLYSQNIGHQKKGAEDHQQRDRSHSVNKENTMFHSRSYLRVSAHEIT